MITDDADGHTASQTSRTGPPPAGPRAAAVHLYCFGRASLKWPGGPQSRRMLMCISKFTSENAAVRLFQGSGPLQDPGFQDFTVIRLVILVATLSRAHQPGLAPHAPVHAIPGVKGP